MLTNLNVWTTKQILMFDTIGKVCVYCHDSERTNSFGGSTKFISNEDGYVRVRSPGDSSNQSKCKHKNNKWWRGETSC